MSTNNDGMGCTLRCWVTAGVIGLLAAIMLFLALSRSSEMVAIRASGRSALRVVAAPASASPFPSPQAKMGHRPHKE